MSSILLEVDGVQYQGWEDISVTKSIENFCGSFQFTTSGERGKPFPIKRRSECKVIIDNITVITGWVEKIEVQFSSNSHRITVSGRDRTNDIIDSQFGSGIEFTPPVTLKQITEKVLKELNLTNIKVINRFNLLPFQDVESVSVGEKGFDIIEKYARKNQVLLTTNGDGNIVFERALTDKLNTVLSTKADNVGIILNSNITYDDTKRFHHYQLVSSTNNASATVFGKQFVSPSKTVNITNQAIDEEIRNSRIYYFKPADTTNYTETLNGAKWEANYRRAQSMVYTCQVQGVKPLNDNGIWTVNKLVRVIDDYADIDSILLISDITYTQSNDKGTITTLKLVTKDSFTLLVNKPIKVKKGSAGNNEGQKIFGVKSTSS